MPLKLTVANGTLGQFLPLATGGAGIRLGRPRVVGDQRLSMLGMPRHFNAKNPFPFMDLPDVQELANFLARRVTA